MVEVGWFARNYLILLEVTRVGARTGTVQQNELSPLEWDNKGSVAGSINPWIKTSPDRSIGEMSDTEWVSVYRNCKRQYWLPRPRLAFTISSAVSCCGRSTHWNGMKGPDPDGNPYPDDIVISTFAVQAVDPAEITDPGHESDITWPLERAGVPGGDSIPQAIVVGRWPDNANECHFDSSGATISDGIDGRDPFDWIEDGGQTLNPALWWCSLCRA